jgi:hypothetical protein
MTVRDNPTLHPRMIIFNIDKAIKLESIIQSVADHVTTDSKVLSQIKFVRAINCKSNTHHHVVIECPGPVYSYHLNKGSVLLEDWSSCRLAEARRVLQCNHCGGYGHRAVDCKRTKARCLFCAGDHAVSACTVRDNPELAKCIHCIKPNNLRTNSPLCPVYQNEMQKVQARISY